MATTKQAQHTPAPWRIERCHILGADYGPQVAAVEPYATCVSPANAEYIVRAVNTNAELLAACRKALESHAADIRLYKGLVPREECAADHWCWKMLDAIAKAPQ